jgi:predicted phage tail protein
MPTLGAVNVPIDTTFTWPTVAGAVSYTFEIAEEIGQIDKFYLKDEVAGPTVNAYKLLDNLKYDTQYWWRVQAVNSLGVKSAWTVSFFTTAKEPVPEPEPLPPVIVEETPAPIITLEIPAAEKVDVIPPYLIWAVIAVGAILVIAVIVLIVRTRRIS